LEDGAAADSLGLLEDGEAADMHVDAKANPSDEVDGLDEDLSLSLMSCHRPVAQQKDFGTGCSAAYFFHKSRNKGGGLEHLVPSGKAQI
jgi:hypothetical protein